LIDSTRTCSWIKQQPSDQGILVSLFRISCTIVIGTLILMGCVAKRPVESPIPVKIYDSGTARTDELIIFLPGRGDDIGAFERSGFIDQLHESNRVADSIVIDAHMGYYQDGSLPERVYQDILIPFRMRGYKHFILVGISLGGYGALWINHEFSELISAMVLLAPYLGRESLIEKIKAEDNVHSWRMQLNQNSGTDEQVWIWVDDMVEPGSAEIPSVILAFGLRDKFRGAGELLSESIPDSHVFRKNGDHDWQTWHSLWSDITKSDSWNSLGYTKQ
jgi:pimeloyl-ACP methyl ester carboxylesterase